ncbi:hypothetical protein MD484_g7821, partial [Candolleomyces efflorescens]
MTIEYPWFFFTLVRPAAVRAKFLAALLAPETVQAVGVEDPQLLVEYLREHGSDPDIRIAACKLFPRPGQDTLAHFNFEYAHWPTIQIPTSAGIVDIGPPAHNMVNQAGAISWVEAYRGMVHDWCAEHRAARLSPNAGDVPLDPTGPSEAQAAADAADTTQEG